MKELRDEAYDDIVDIHKEKSRPSNHDS